MALTGWRGSRARRTARPIRRVLLVGQTQAEAEARARQWADSR